MTTCNRQANCSAISHFGDCASMLSTTTQTQELKPCPFCGSDSVVWSEHFRRVRCNGCFIGTAPLGDHPHSPETLLDLKTRSVTAWNTRAPSDTEQRLREALEPLVSRLTKMTENGPDCECPAEGHFCGWPALQRELEDARAAQEEK